MRYARNKKISVVALRRIAFSQRRRGGMGVLYPGAVQTRGSGTHCLFAGAVQTSLVDSRRGYSITVNLGPGYSLVRFRLSVSFSGYSFAIKRFLPFSPIKLAARFLRASTQLSARSPSLSPRPTSLSDRGLAEERTPRPISRIFARGDVLIARSVSSPGDFSLSSRFLVSVRLERHLGGGPSRPFYSKFRLSIR